jgi:hypothetical protein
VLVSLWDARAARLGQIIENSIDGVKTRLAIGRAIRQALCRWVVTSNSFGIIDWVLSIWIPKRRVDAGFVSAGRGLQGERIIADRSCDASRIFGHVESVVANLHAPLLLDSSQAHRG